MMRALVAVVALCLLAAGCSRPPDAPAADLVLTGGVIHTFDAARSRAEAIAIRDGRIVAVGTTADVQRLAGPGTRTVDLSGRLVLPAFHDAHVHPMSAGVELGQCNLNGLPSAAATLDAIRACVAGNGARPWLVGGGWLLTTFPAGQPRREELDAITGNLPAVLSSSDGHTVWVNSAALKAADLIEKERNVAALKAAEDAERAKAEGKPVQSAEIVARRVEGSVQKYLKEVSLFAQPFVKNDKQTVEQMLKEKGTTLAGFTMYIVGEGIAKKTDDFAAEVAAQVAAAKGA